MDGFNLNLKKYCSYCGHFSPVLDQTQVTSYGDSVEKVINDISCRHKVICEHMAEELKLRK